MSAAIGPSETAAGTNVSNIGANMRTHVGTEIRSRVIFVFAVIIVSRNSRKSV